MTAQPVRVLTPRPPPPRYIPGKCYALKTPADRRTHCLESARFYPCGWRCEMHAPCALKTSTETSPERTEKAA